MTDVLVVLALFAGMALFLWVFHVLDEQRKEREHERARELEKLKGEIAMSVSRASHDFQKDLLDYAQKIRDEGFPGDEWKRH